METSHRENVWHFGLKRHSEERQIQGGVTERKRHQFNGFKAFFVFGRTSIFQLPTLQRSNPFPVAASPLTMGNCQAARVGQASPSPPPPSSRIQDYTRFATSAERVDAAYKANVRAILDTHGSPESTLDFDESTVETFLEGQRVLGLTEAEVARLSRKIIYHHIVEKKEANPHKTFWLFLKTTMGYADMGTDIATMVRYATLNPSIATAQGGILGLSFLAQFLTSVGLGQPLWVGLVGLIGMKPMLEAWRDAMEAKPYPGQKVGNDFMLWLTRITEMVVSRWVV